MEDAYDFLIVGAGPSGCVLASRLAHSAAKPRVLLIEAGSCNNDPKHQISGERFFTHATAEGYNWGYKTVPQQYLKGRQINYSRGRGLGGSSAINFQVYVRGPKDDFNEWARQVDDMTWCWDQVNRKFNAIETYHGDVSEALNPYVDAPHTSHGHHGPLDLGFASSLEAGLEDLFCSAKECGFPINLDLNSGNPIGVGIPASTALNGVRVTASTAYLSRKPENLVVFTETVVTGIIFRDRRAIGVKTSIRNFYASKKVILSAGALDTPKILLLSGIGPAEELKQLNINVMKDAPGIGKGLRDHFFAPLTLLQKPATNDRAKLYNDPAAMEAAQKQFNEDASGPLAHFYCAVTMAFLKSEHVINSAEFQELPIPVQEHLQRETVPHYEFTSHTPPLWVNEHEELKPTDTYLSILAFGQNPQSTGSVRLKSADPRDGLLIDPQFLSHAFDRRSAIEAVRHTLDLIESPSLSKSTIRLIGAPRSRSDEDILDYVRSTLYSSWHMCGTVKMGKPGEETTCVDKNFRVVGIDALLVVDMSIAPIMTNNHTQSVAYLIGETAAEKLIQEYGMDNEMISMKSS